MNRFAAAFWTAILAGCIAHDCGVPLWRDWEPGDCADIMFCAFAIVWDGIGAILLAPRSKPLVETPKSDSMRSTRAGNSAENPSNSTS